MKLLKALLLISVVGFVMSGCGDGGYSQKELLERGKAGREVGKNGAPGGHQASPGQPTGPRPAGR